MLGGYEKSGLTWSDEIYRIFGYEPGEIIPSIEIFLAAVYPEDRPLVYESERLSEKTGRQDLVHRIVRPDGAVRHVHELARAEVDDQGKLVRLTGTVQDISERVEAEKQLRETEQRFAFAVEGAGDGVWDWNVLSGEMTFSGNYESMLGFEPGELESTIDGWTRMVHPEDLTAVQRRLTDYVEGRVEQYSVELRLWCKDGQYKWILCRGTVVETDSKGNPLRLIGIHSDIDQRKSAEQTLEVFRHVVNSVMDGVLVIDTQGLIQLASPAASRIFGHSQGALKGSCISMLVPDRMYSDADSEIKSFLQNPEASISHRHREMTGLRADGIEFPIEVAVSEIFVGTSHYFVGLVRDITDRKRAELELIAAREDAERANHAKSNFLSSMSHELRTPMNAILGFGQLMEYDSSLPDEHLDNVKEILNAGEHLLTLINEILDLAKVESGNIDLSLESVALGSVVDECLSLVGLLARNRNIEIDAQNDHGIIVLADRTRLKQVLINLLTNAIKYNYEGGRVRVEMRAYDDELVQLRIIDTGPGIAEGRLSELFQPFNRLDAENTDTEGTGIGLTITRRITEMMGGSIGVESEVGVGSTFWLDLPMKTDSGEAAGEFASPFAAEIPKHSDETGNKQTVLYVEDNPANLKLVTQILDQIPGVRLIAADNGLEGLELAKAHSPDVILMDINLPGMSGYEVLELLKEDVNLRSTPVIAITANAMPHDVARGQNAGFDNYLTKPLNIRHFLGVIKPLLEPIKSKT